MKIYEYEDYEEYVAIQTDANKRKIKRNHSFVNRNTIALIWRLHHGLKVNILCHGTRKGLEQRFFKAFYPKAVVIGTEISDNATKYPNTVQHDFHTVNEDWIDNFHIIYSNSWDHSYDPVLSLTTWRDQLRGKYGRIYLEHAYSPANNTSSAVDPLEISHKEIIKMIDNNDMMVNGIFETYGGGSNDKPCRLYVIKKNRK